MPDQINHADFAGIEVVVHAALMEYTPKTRDADAVNREGTRRVMEAAREHGARVVFLSTLSAHEDAASHYGRSKLELERMFEPSRDCILRLGLVLGRGGLFTSITELLKTGRVVPLPGGGKQPLQILYMDDFLKIVANVVEQHITGRFEVAAPTVYTMRELYESVIRNLGVKPMLLPVPLWIVELGVTALEVLGIPFPIRRENVLGLKCLRAFDTVGSLRTLGLDQAVPLEDSVRRLLSSQANPGG
jgi:NADH dehydrogenase